MKVIDLLNKIANGEEVPKKVKYCDEIFTFNNDDCNFLYKYQVGKCQLFGCCRLNDEVEILEEEKKIPEKLEDYDFDDGLDANTKCECLRERMQEIENQLDEIIDYLKSKGK